jgi:hypothetical protein
MCVATGQVINGDNQSISELWNGRTWTVKSVPRPRGTTYSALLGVSCIATTRCTAVGDYQVHGSSKSRTLAESWNGVRWLRRRSPNHADGRNGDGLSAVSCSVPRRCTAVGSYSATTGLAQPLAERWTGAAWTLSAARRPRTGGAFLAAVSCVGAHPCLAIGSSSAGAALAERWNGRSWTMTAIPNPKTASFVNLVGISCAATHACLAVGSYFRGSSEQPIAQVWDGTKWRITAPPG